MIEKRTTFERFKKRKRTDENALNSFLLFIFTSANFQTTDSKFCFHNLIEKSSFVTVKNFIIRNFDKNRKYNHIQLYTENKTIETSLNKSVDDEFAHIDIKDNTAKNSLNFVYSTNDVKTIDHDVNLISILKQCASTKNSDINDIINVTSKNIKKIVNNLNHMQSNNRNTNSTTTLTQSFSFIDIDLKKKQIRKMNYIEKKTFN